MELSNPHPDNRYLTALLNNDSRLIREIYQQFSTTIARLVESNHGTADEAQDIFQEGLMAITRQARNGNLVLTCSFKTFLYMVCRKKWLNELKKRRQQGVTFVDVDRFRDEVDGMALALEVQREEELFELLERKLKELSPGCQQILRLSWSGAPLQNIAETLGNTYDYIKKKKSECKHRLLDLLRSALDVD